MNSEDEVIQILRDAIARHDPQSLLQLSDQFSTGDSVLRLRGNLHGFIISPYDYDLNISMDETSRCYSRKDSERSRTIYSG